MGGTGCGKSTQLPQYILDDCAARGQTASVMVTQPRRMAAVTLARRIARERGEAEGTEVGWRIRGDVKPGRQLTFATAGYLLSWFTVDPSVFGSLTHIILDEAHERTADMDLLILVVRTLMRFYPRPRVVIMSATIDGGFFTKYFEEFMPPAGAAAVPAVAPASPGQAGLPACPGCRGAWVRARPGRGRQCDRCGGGWGRGGWALTCTPCAAAVCRACGVAAADAAALPAAAPVAAWAPLSVGSNIFPVETLYLEDMSEGRGPRSRLPDAVSKTAARCVSAVFGGAERAKESVIARVHPDVEKLAISLIPLVAEAGSTILVFIPGYADLIRIHSKLYWSLPMAGATDVPVRAPPRPEMLREDEDGELKDLEELTAPAKRRSQGRRSQVGSESAAGPGDEPGAPKVFRLFALHSQVPNEDQDAVLARPKPGVCHVVLATNIAESSVTLPDVCGVLDFGVYKTTFSDPRQPSMVQLTSSWCSRASLKQRQGRAGRTRPGWCLQLFTKAFSEHMPDFEEPEILRTPLTRLWLQAKGVSDGLTRALQHDEEASRRLAASDTSPGALLRQLPMPPSAEAVDAAVRDLAELGVLTEQGERAEVTAVGRLALWLPLDVRLCRLLWLGALWGCAPE
ncbi:unnamed protein product, partial [Prorocentrum cordatum]